MSDLTAISLGSTARAMARPSRSGESTALPWGRAAVTAAEAAARERRSRLFELLRHWARQGAVCPSDAAIAADLGVPKTTVLDDLQRLRQRGDIVCEGGRWRVLRIPRDGSATAAHAGAGLALPGSIAARLDRLYAVLRDLAQQKKPCPDDATLAQRLGWPQWVVVDGMLRLRQDGRIVTARGAGRIVHITEDGSATAPRRRQRARRRGPAEMCAAAEGETATPQSPKPPAAAA